MEKTIKLRHWIQKTAGSGYWVEEHMTKETAEKLIAMDPPIYDRPEIIEE